MHATRAIRAHDLDAIYVIGPGHGGPAIVANAFLEGSYSEVYPVSQDADGMRRLFEQFSFPGGIPSHVAPETPGSIHEGGELGYALSHAFGAAFDNPDLLVPVAIPLADTMIMGPLARLSAFDSSIVRERWYWRQHRGQRGDRPRRTEEAERRGSLARRAAPLASVGYGRLTASMIFTMSR